ncbi:hypothetical protein ACFL2L_00705 [Patescibacteria group bacterium]
MVDSDKKCSNNICGLSKSTLVPFPWTKCYNCGKILWDFDFSVDKITVFILISSIAVIAIGLVGVLIAKKSPVDIMFFKVLTYGSFGLIATLISYIIFSVSPKIMWKVLWQPFLGTLFFVLGVIFTNGTLFFIGIFALLTWYFSQRYYDKCLNLIPKHKKLAFDRDVFQNAHPKPLDPADFKELKDKNDGVKAVEWESHHISSKQWLTRCVGATMIVLVLIFAGPGSFLYRNEIANNVIEQTDKGKNFFKPIIEEAKERLGNKGEIQYLHNNLTEAGLDRTEIYEIIKQGHITTAIDIYNYKEKNGVTPKNNANDLKSEFPEVIKIIKNGLNKIEEIYWLKDLGLTLQQINALSAVDSCNLIVTANKVSKSISTQDQLYAEIELEFTKVKAEKENSKLAISKKISDYILRIRGAIWTWLWILFLILLFIDLIFLLLTIFSSIVHKIYTITDEVNDKLVYLWKRHEEKRKEKEAKETGHEYKKDADFEKLETKVKGKGGLGFLDVLGIDLFTDLIQLFIRKL